jgi:hypothetical protein
MSYQCGCPIDLCTVLVCDNKSTVNFNVNATIDGEYTLLLSFQGTAKKYTDTFIAGSSITFDLCNLNENYCYTGTIFDPANIPLIDFKFCTEQIFAESCQ